MSPHLITTPDLQEDKVGEEGVLTMSSDRSFIYEPPKDAFVRHKKEQQLTRNEITSSKYLIKKRYK